MSNDLGKTDGHVHQRTGDGRTGHPLDARGQRAPLTASGFNPDSRRAGGDALNLLLTNQLLSALSAEEFARLFPHLEPVSLAAGEVLYKLDAEVRFAYFPETAVVSHLHILSEGAMTESDMVGREGVAGLSAIFNVPPPSYVSEVSLAGSALRARVDVLRQEFWRGGDFQRVLFRYAAARIALLSHRAVCNSNHRLEERLCTWLLMMHDRAGGDQPLPLTHERISRHLGTRRAGVTSAATLLRDRGLIDYTRGHIHITDRAGLEAAACECYPTVRQSFDIAR